MLRTRLGGDCALSVCALLRLGNASTSADRSAAKAPNGLRWSRASTPDVPRKGASAAVNPWFWAWITLVVVFALGEARHRRAAHPAVGVRRCRRGRCSRRSACRSGWQWIAFIAVSFVLTVLAQRLIIRRDEVAEGRPRSGPPLESSAYRFDGAPRIVRQRPVDHTATAPACSSGGGCGSGIGPPFTGGSAEDPLLRSADAATSFRRATSLNDGPLGERGPQRHTQVDDRHEHEQGDHRCEAGLLEELPEGDGQHDVGDAPAARAPRCRPRVREASSRLRACRPKPPGGGPPPNPCGPPGGMPCGVR